MNKRERFNVLKRFGFKCVYCGRKPPEVELEVDHRVPRALGGGDGDNLVASCRDCNRGKWVTSDQDDDGIVIVCDPITGHVDHERSLKLSGLWASTPEEVRRALKFSFTAPLEIALLDVRDAEIELKKVQKNLHDARVRAFRAQSSKWFQRK